MQLQANNTTFNGSAIMSKKGKVVGHDFNLGVGSISQARKDYRAAGLSANQANAKIAEDLKNGKGSLGWVQAQAAMELTRSRGQFPTKFTLRDGSAVLRFAAAPAEKAAKDSAKVKAAKDEAAAKIVALNAKAIAALVAKGMTEAEATAMMA